MLSRTMIPITKNQRTLQKGELNAVIVTSIIHYLLFQLVLQQLLLLRRKEEEQRKHVQDQPYLLSQVSLNQILSSTNLLQRDHGHLRLYVGYYPMEMVVVAVLPSVLVEVLRVPVNISSILQLLLKNIIFIIINIHYYLSHHPLHYRRLAVEQRVLCPLHHLLRHYYCYPLLSHLLYISKNKQSNNNLNNNPFLVLDHPPKNNHHLKMHPSLVQQ